jgi:hypothetical protein
MTSNQRFERIENALDRITNTLGAVVDNQAKFDAVLSDLAESHIKTQEELRTLTIQVTRTQEGLATLERQWQAYLNTIRPQ